MVSQHDPEDVTGRVYLLAILVFEKLLFFDPRSPRGIWAIQTARDSLAWLDEVLPGRLSSV